MKIIEFLILFSNCLNYRYGGPVHFFVAEVPDIGKAIATPEVAGDGAALTLRLCESCDTIIVLLTRASITAI